MQQAFAGLLATSFAVVLLLTVLSLAVICCLKGKWFVGILALPLLLTGVPAIAACRLARPDSWWAMHRYQFARQEQSRQRWKPRTKAQQALLIVLALAVLAVAVAESTVLP